MVIFLCMDRVHLLGYWLQLLHDDDSNRNYQKMQSHLVRIEKGRERERERKFERGSELFFRFFFFLPPFLFFTYVCFCFLSLSPLLFNSLCLLPFHLIAPLLFSFFFLFSESAAEQKKASSGGGEGDKVADAEEYAEVPARCRWFRLH